MARNETIKELRADIREARQHIFASERAKQSDLNRLLDIVEKLLQLVEAIAKEGK